jgi:hypothetical protein
MLVLTRGVDEAIVVGDSIVRVVEIQEQTVRLGIASPHTRDTGKSRCGATPKPIRCFWSCRPR